MAITSVEKKMEIPKNAYLGFKHDQFTGNG
jgi:hypothetical protein